MRTWSLFLCGMVLAVSANALQLVVGPYMNCPTEDSIVIRWETDTPAASVVRWGEELPLAEETVSAEEATYHEVKLTGLTADTPYLYSVVSRDAAGEEVSSPVLSFGTAVRAGDAFGFVVLCDTQATPAALHQLAVNAYAQRPSFTLFGGDLVTDGNDKTHWTGHFFPNMAPLNERVPLVPALGNHENNSAHYYDYFTLPEPEYFYKFPYGDLDVFLLDSQKPMGPGSEQFAWLEKELTASRATWKIVMFHKPPYSSDENDYGDTTKEKSVHGDLKTREVVPLLEEHGVDIVWSGHIHTYERTWPLRSGKVVADGAGPIYMITGGGGGGLENAAPVRNGFTAKVYRGHHYCYVTVHGGKLRVEAYDLKDRLFDFVELEK